MGKYIDADKLIAEIERRKVPFKKDMEDGVYPTYLCALMDFEDLIDNLQQEQPSIPSNLDEAAREYAYNNWEDNDYHTGASEGLPFDAIGHTEKCFKAGAEWMAGQGVILNLSIDEFSCGAYNACVEQGLTSEDDVIVQIRKKEENHD